MKERNRMDKIKCEKWKSPVGELIIGSFGDIICLCDWNLVARRRRVDSRLARCLGAEPAFAPSASASAAIMQLEEYFAGARKAFDVALVLTGNQFQQRVWTELMKIPYGATASYADIASRIGSPCAVRAVASAIASNPVSIIVPCHRVIASSGALAGYAGGLSAKKSLLALESPGLF